MCGKNTKENERDTRHELNKEKPTKRRIKK